MAATAADKKKQVRWGTVSVLEFRVGYNASTVPTSGGPPIGLIGRPARHSYSMISAEDEEETEDESVDSESDTEMAAVATSSSKRSQNDLWVCPMERARILAEENNFSLEDVALICSDVRATLDSRSYSQLDQVAEKMLQCAEVTRIQDLRNLRYSFHDAREKVLLF
ncbi:hypothetical protein BBJ28_00016319 [Nothophytophthora sp. Chile5]|nr:hypothetical protein BBJ28_00016319 [Nothophytophthora sp. Chile5]